MSVSRKREKNFLSKITSKLATPFLLMMRIQPLAVTVGRIDNFLTQAVDHRMYDFFFRRSVFASIILLIAFNLLLDIILKQKALEDYLSLTEQQLLDLSPHTLVVINAVPRTTLTQKRVKVPVIKEVNFAVEEIEIPEPEFGAVQIGPDQPSKDSGSGTGQGRLPYRRPELVMLVPPVYPKDAEKKGIEGTVDLRILVTPKGTVDEVEIAQSSGHSGMDEAAIKAAKRTRFRPAIKDGQRVAMWINYPIQFALSRKNN